MNANQAPETPFDVITTGRIGVDIYPPRTGVPLRAVESFGEFLGGSATNVAVAAARLGCRAAVISRTGRDPFGEYCRQALTAEFGVDARWVTEVPEYPTPVTFCEIIPPDDFPLYFYQLPKSPDLEIHSKELNLAAICAARIFWMTGTVLCEQPSRTATMAALAARSEARTAKEAGAGAAQTATVFDLDWRPMFWHSGPEEARAYYTQALRHATVSVGNLEECALATGEREPRACAEALLAAGVELAVVKQGPKGVLAVHRDGGEAEVPPHPVEVVNEFGAGDAFGGSLCHGPLSGWDLTAIMRYANAAGALVASRRACCSAMPTTAEVDALLSSAEVPG